MDLQIIKGSFKDVPLGFGAFAVMGIEGDSKHIWDKNNQAEIEAAKVLFNTLVKEKKYLAFKVNDKGDKGEQVREFDPKEERYIFSPPLCGG